MIDLRAIELAKSIYSSYKDVIDFIIDNAATNKFSEACRNFIKKHNMFYEASTGNSIYFTNKLVQEMPTPDMLKWQGKRPICFWFRKNGDSKLGLVIEVGPVIDIEIRKRLLLSLQEAGFRLHKNALEPGTKYSRVYSDYKEFDDWDEIELIEEFLEKLYFQNAKASMGKLESVIASWSRQSNI